MTVIKWRREAGASRGLCPAEKGRAPAVPRQSKISGAATAIAF
jgi:hypothetical protein